MRLTPCRHHLNVHVAPLGQLEQSTQLAAHHFLATEPSLERDLLDHRVDHRVRRAAQKLLALRASSHALLDFVIIEDRAITAEYRPRVLLGLEQPRNHMVLVDAERCTLRLVPCELLEPVREFALHNVLGRIPQQATRVAQQLGRVDECKLRPPPPLLHRLHQLHRVPGLLGQLLPAHPRPLAPAHQLAPEHPHGRRPGLRLPVARHVSPLRPFPASRVSHAG